MIKLTVLYPHRDGARFDMDYYLAKHVPLVREKVGAACKAITVDQGLAGGAPGTNPTFVAIFQMSLDSLESFQSAVVAHVPTFVADIPNFTDIEPVIQLDEVKLA